MIQGSKHHTVDLLDWQILQYEPFTSDRDSNVKVLSDVMVVTRDGATRESYTTASGFSRLGERVQDWAAEIAARI